MDLIHLIDDYLNLNEIYRLSIFKNMLNMLNSVSSDKNNHVSDFGKQ